jgi:hypothetical protein
MLRMEEKGAGFEFGTDLRVEREWMHVHPEDIYAQYGHGGGAGKFEFLRAKLQLLVPPTFYDWGKVRRFEQLK